MKKLHFVAILIGSALLYACGNAKELTEADINLLIKRHDDAIRARDVVALGKNLSGNAQISMHTDMQGEEQIETVSKAEYLRTLELGWSLASNYEYSRSNLKISLLGQKAEVSDELSESMTIKGLRLSAYSTESFTIEMIEGRPLVTKVVSYSTIQ